MKKIYYVIFLFSFFVIGCKNNSGDNKVKIENKTNGRIICLFSYDYPNLNIGLLNQITLVSADAPKFTISPNEIKEVDTLGLCNKEVWDENIKHGMLIVFVIAPNKIPQKDQPDNSTRRYYFTHEQLMKNNGIITIE